MFEIIVHRGLSGVSYDNSIVGVLAAIFRKKFTEFDILFVDGVWKLCHDFHVLSIFHTPLPELLQILKKYRHLVNNNIIIDIKWDFIHNRNDDLEEAIHILKKELIGFEGLFWLQASNTKILTELLALQGVWKLGLIVRHMNDFNAHNQFLHYAMISLSGFTMEEICFMRDKCLVFGYTCHNITELVNYKHLFKYLNGVVCDVW